MPKVFIHFFGDGRDTDPKSGADYMQELVEKTKELGVGQIATVVGRYFAMDRDKRWERIEIALKGLVLGEGEKSDDPVATVRERYKRNGDKDRDEFLTPIFVNGDDGRIKGEWHTAPTSRWWRRAMGRGGKQRWKLIRDQMTTLSSSSTTDPTAFVKSLSSLATSIALSSPTFPTRRSTSS